jgi:Protein of unknown function (DUF732)
MRLLGILTSVAALVGMAAPVHADSGNGDDAFLAALTRAGITYQSPDRAVAAGKAVCNLANVGRSERDILRDIRDLNPGFTLDSAAKFTQAAASVYCPDRLTTDTNGGNGNSGAK